MLDWEGPYIQKKLCYGDSAVIQGVQIDVHNMAFLSSSLTNDLHISAIR
jgi:hypothetical protein